MAETILEPLQPAATTTPATTTQLVSTEPTPASGESGELGSLGEPSEPSGLSKAWTYAKDHWVSIGLILAMIIVLIIIIIGFTSGEHFGDGFYLDQMAMLNTDPTYFKYAGNERDILGESGRDYYLVNQMYANSRAAPQLLEDNFAYVNQTDYLDMPHAWRPLPIRLTADPLKDRFVRPIFRKGQSGNVMEQELGPERDVY